MATATRVGPRLIDGFPWSASASTQREAFECFPYSLLVLSGDGRVVCANRQAMCTIDALALPNTGLTCCALLGCRLVDTVLDGRCLTELALASGRVLPELRVELACATGARVMWVTAAPLAGADARVVLQLRPGCAEDGRTCASWMGGPQLHIRTLGTTVLEAPDGPLTGAWLEQRTGQLLKYLIAERRRAVTVDEIGEAIWPEADYAASASVRYYVHALRRKLEPARGPREPSAFVTAGCGSYRLAREHVAVDADEFEARLSAALDASRLDPQGAAGELEAALALYHGEFLADLPYAEWAMAERHHLHALACSGLRRLADARLEGHDLDDATRALERLATLQPFDEDVHRRLMELDVAQGRRSDAVRRYAELRCRLRRTFGHDPAFTPPDLARPRV
ncbi:MAG TPA: BTAD domain-containing putative transcriptional regulator [Solirubrobacteraceae bacterium]|nr:BTAD domain-containing putative transcriptional regulator [Solirubrobacteraceae bacterium]